MVNDVLDFSKLQNDSFIEKTYGNIVETIQTTMNSLQVLADEKKVSGFIFKIQANMDPKHRDRIAFMRICSGHFKRGMTLHQTRTGKGLKIPTPVMFLAQERELAEDAYAGDIIGIPNHGQLRIGDSLTEGEKLNFTGIPSFAPELLKSVRALDPLKSKHLGDALKQIAEEGGASVFKPIVGAEWIVGVVGVLQFEVMADRIKNEFGLPVMFEPTQYYTARWIAAQKNDELKKFMDANRLNIAEDNDGEIVFLARNAWHLNKASEDFPKIVFSKTKESCAAQA
jgi:peptide chain release factor 3